MRVLIWPFRYYHQIKGSALMSDNNATLVNIFQTVAQTLIENQQNLNQADSANQDHGDNMVKTFQTITNALQKKQGSSTSDALAYAAQQVGQTATSSSGKLYAQGLTQAASQMQGKQLDLNTGVQLLQTLIGGGQAPAQQADSGGDMITSLLGGLMGGAQGDQSQPAQGGGDMLGELLGGLAGAQQSQPQQGGDLLGSLLGGLAGGNSSGGSSAAGANDGLDMGDLLNAGMAFYQAKQGGGSTAQALLQAVLAGSGMGGSSHRQQSTQLVANAFMQALGALGKN
jgi:hypothetical protein